MITQITIGQYYPADSPIHRLDPRVKLIGSFAYITMLFALRGALGYAFAGLSLAIIVLLSKVPVGYIFRGLRMIMYILVFTAGLNLFFAGGETVLVSFWKITVTLEGVLTALMMTVRLVFLMTGASMMTLTTSPIQLTAALEFFLKPFRRIGVPSHEIAMIMMIALRFIPALIEELDKIMKAQTARGADFDTGGPVKKAKGLVPMLVPLFISCFRRADELAVAMEARCYRGDEGRTRMKVMRFGPIDYKAFALIAAFIGAIIAMNIIL